MWKDFFYFSKTERKGILLLAILIIGVNVISFFLHTLSSPASDSTESRKQFEKEYNEFLSSIHRIEEKRKYNDWESRPAQNVYLTFFDPNTADSAMFSNLGLPPWMIKNILRYRSKSGKFRKASDFRKIYGLSEKQYQTLLPYIRITDVFDKKDTVRLQIETKEKHDTIYKYPAGTLVSLNQADTTELKMIPGIGSNIARTIVNYRKKLGAFYCIEQLQEIHLKVESLRPWFSIDTSHTPRINLNTASVERLMKHPYFNFYQAKAIVEYRKKNGKLKSLKQLALYEEFSSTDFERISHYICF